MALTASEESAYERNFGHCIVSWKIKNFSLSICNPETEIFTEEFPVTSSIVTRWRIGFRVKSDGNLHIVLKLVGGEFDESLTVSWKITILDGKDEATFVSENRTYMPIELEQEVDVVSPSYILRALPAEKSDEVKIEFQIIVLMDTPMSIPTPNDNGLKALINDMKLIAKEGFLSDVIVMLNGKNIKAHRAIVYPRCEKLSRYAGCPSKKIQLNLSDDEAVSSIFAYLYTGDLNSILVPPSISIYDYIMHLDIKELRDAYPQETISLETAIEATNYEFRWTILDFNSADELRKSEIFEADGMDSKWQIHIYPKELAPGTEMQRMYVYIEALVVSSVGSRNVYVNFIAKNDKGLITIARRTYGKTTPGERLGVFFMRFGSPSMAKSVVGNVLDISFSVHIATGEMNSIVLESHPPVPYRFSNFDTYNIGYYTGLLQNDETYSDITLVLGKQQFRAHKFLLGGRSVTFSRMIAGLKTDSTTLLLHRMHDYVFRVFLDYLYMAVLTNVETRVLLHLFDIASYFQVESLVSICAEHLVRQLTPGNCCEILLFAEKRNLNEIKTPVLHFIAAHHELIIDIEGWRYLEKYFPKLYNEVVVFLERH